MINQYQLEKMHPLSSHLCLAHHYWKLHLKPGDQVLDATCGNGKDTLFMAQLVLSEEHGRVFGLDIQEKAVQRTHQLLNEELNPQLMKNVHLFHQSHTSFPPVVKKKSLNLIVYNLGYLPGGDKSLTTMTSSTLESVRNSFNFLSSKGMISITCYPGHPEGALEETALLEWLTTLDAKEWLICHHQWKNKKLSPSLVIIKRK